MEGGRDALRVVQRRRRQQREQSLCTWEWLRVKERTKLKMMREYVKANTMREGLRTRFNVLINDRLKQWSTGGGFVEEHNAG